MTDCPVGLECKTDPCPILEECQHAQAAADHAAEDHKHQYRQLAPTEAQAVAYINANTRLLTDFVTNYTKGLGDAAKRRAAIAATNYEQAAMWAVKAMVGE